jgi:hypothetical protein
MRWLRNISSASCRVVPIGAVMRFLVVIKSSMGLSLSVSKRRSRLVKMPTSNPVSSTTGIPPILFSRMSWKASPTRALLCMVIGSMIMPLSALFTRRTCSACAAMVMFLWMIPMPPSRAMAMAIRYSVTVSIAAEMSGTLMRRFRVSLLEMSTSRGRTSE